MKKKLTLWAALCMVFVCLMSMTAAAAGTATISQCVISGGNQITVVAAASGVASDDGNLYLFEMNLIHELTDVVNLNELNSSDVIVNNVRHYEALLHALSAIQRVHSGLQSDLSGEFISQDIRECLHYLGEITGEITTDEVLGNIFERFCIGK